jgi:hypothetical protein
MCHSHFSYRPINSNVLWGCIRHTVWEAAELDVNVFPAIVYADFETAIHNAVTTVWPGLEVKACRFHLGQSWWRKIQSLGLSKQYGKRDSEVSQFLKKIFGLSLWPLFYVGIFIQSSEWQASGTVLRLPASKFCWCRFHFSSACLVRNYCITTEDHKSKWVIPCNFNALFYSVHHNIFVLVSALQKI